MERPLGTLEAELFGAFDFSVLDAVAQAPVRIDFVPVRARRVEAVIAAQARVDRIHGALGFRHGRLDAGLDGIGRVSHLTFQFAKLVELHLAVDVPFDIVDIPAKLADPFAHLLGDLWQALRTDHHQRNYANDHHFGKPDIEHVAALCEKMRTSVAT